MERRERYNPVRDIFDAKQFHQWVESKISSYQVRCRGRNPYTAECSDIVSPASLARFVAEHHPGFDVWIRREDRERGLQGFAGRFQLIVREKEGFHG